ncbi:MAG: putative Ig domain-containing protein [Crenarchaeota archaeon]|nr:putative Ig domain-containing protein [Thermoproteota archaeon]
MTSLNLTFVSAQMTIKPDKLPDAVLVEHYEVYLYIDTQATIDNWEISSGTLPPGLTLSKLDSYRGVISGTPSSPGAYSFTVKATKIMLGQPKPIIIYKDYTITVKGLEIHPDTLPQAVENSSYVAKIWVTGGSPPYSWSVTGLPTELTNLTWQLVSGRTDQLVISGTPLIGSHGNYSIELRVRDSSGLSTSKPYLLNVKEAPWEFSVAIRRLTEEGAAYRAVVYIDDFTFPSASAKALIAEDIFEVTVRRTSGTGNRSVRLDLIALPGETMPLGITMSMSRSTGLVGNEAFASVISIKIDNKYPHLSEERDLRLILRTRVINVRDDNKTIVTTIRGIEADVRVSAFPIQVLNDAEELVAGKSTIFKVNAWIVCNRQPKIDGDIELDVRLVLPFSEWEWELPDTSTAASGWVEATVRIPRRLAIDISTGKHVGRTSIYLPEAHSYVDSIGEVRGRVTVVYSTAPFPRSIPRPKYCVFAYPPSYTGERREDGTVIYTVQADISNRVREINEDNNEFSSTKRVVRTKPIKILLYPWAENATEKARGLAGRSEASFRSDVLTPNARTQVEFLQAVFPTAEGGIRYSIDPTIRIRDLYQTCAADYNDMITYPCWGGAPCDCGRPCNGACRDWCNCAIGTAWNYLYGTEGLARMADDAGYDFAIAFRVVGGGGCTWSGSRPMAAYVDIDCCYSCLTHEIYHVLGPMPYDDYSCPVANQCPEGYWVNSDEHIEAGRCYIMSACGGAPWWITRQMYETLMCGWFNPSGGDPVAIRVSGVINQNGTGRFYPFRVRNASRVETPGLFGNYSIVLLDSNGAELSRFGVNATFWGEMHTDMYSFMFYVPYSKDVHVIELRDSENRVLDRRVSSANWPRVKILLPKAGEIVSSLRKSFTISWEGRDADGDALYYTVLISPDGGGSWLPIDIDLTVNSITWDSSVYDASENYVVKVIVSDGFYSAENISSPFTIGPYAELKAESPYGEPRGSGWYMVNETATFSIAPTRVKMDGLLGVLGGYYEFTGWSGDSASTSPASTILMDSDKTVTAVFKPNYTMPMILLAAMLIVLLVVSAVVLRKRRKHAALPPPPPPPSFPHLFNRNTPFEQG